MEQDKTASGNSADKSVPHYLATSLFLGLGVAAAICYEPASQQDLHVTTLSVYALLLTVEGLAIGFFWRRWDPSTAKSAMLALFSTGYWFYLGVAVLSVLAQAQNPSLLWPRYAAAVGMLAVILPIFPLAIVTITAQKGLAQMHTLTLICTASIMVVASTVLRFPGLPFAHRHSPDSTAMHGDSHKGAQALAHQPAKVAHGAAEPAPAANAAHHAPTPSAHGSAPQANSHGDKPHWSYDGEGGPAHWGQLHPEWATCMTGAEQSPVDIPKQALFSTDGVQLDYQSEAGRILDNGHTIQVEVDNAHSVAKVGGDVFTLKQFHFHAPSEHTFAGESFPLEVHFVHKSKRGQLAVLGAMIRPGALNQELQKILQFLPPEPNAERALAKAFQPRSILPTTLSVTQYHGSLTTPPCSEGVLWSVLKEPLLLSIQQINQLKQRYSHTNRPTMPINRRHFGPFESKAH